MQSFKNIALCWALLFAVVAVVFMANDASAFESDDDAEVDLGGEGRADSMDDMNTASENRIFGWLACRIACNSACAAAGVTGNTSVICTCRRLFRVIRLTC